MRRSQAGQATVEWSALLLALVLAFAAMTVVVARTDAWGLGERVVHALACAVEGGCEERDSLALAYGDELAEQVRSHAPNLVYERRSAALPIDFRRCRETGCSDGSDAAGAIERSASGLPVTAFTRVVDRRDRGGALYLQYWFYYPESFTGGIGRVFGDAWPGYHPDDWEAYQVRVAPGGRVSARATAHGGYASDWSTAGGWYRVSGGSHAGHLVDLPYGERMTPASKLSLVPLERLTGTERYAFEVTPPWRKEVYTRPESASS
ncbi:MAG: hypothetical protein ACRDLQ_06735 [Solirubrobacterales bacterium]